MKPLSAPQLRNVAVVGHNTVGKTTLVAAMLYAAGAITRPGQDRRRHLPDRLRRGGDRPQDLDQPGVAHAIHRDTRINFLDAPGYGIFAPEARAAVHAADSAIIVLDAVSGVEVQTERAWKFAQEFRRPVLFVVNRMDRERASFDRVVEALRKKFGRGVVPLQIPVGEEKGFHGTVDLVRMEAHVHEDGKRSDGPIPADLAERAKAEHEALVEAVAEGEDDLMEKFFAQGTLEPQDILPGLKREIVERKIFPVLCASSSSGIGAMRILDACVALLPSPRGPQGGGRRQGRQARRGLLQRKGPRRRPGLQDGVRSLRGTHLVPARPRRALPVRRQLLELDQSAHERFSGLFLPQGKEHVSVPEAHAGDIVAVAKLKDTFTGDTLTTKDNLGRPADARGAGGLDRLRHRAEGQGRRGQDLDRAPQADRGGSRRSTSSATRRPRSSTSPAPRSSTSRSPWRG